MVDLEENEKSKEQAGLDFSQLPQTLKLKTKDGDIVEVPSKIAQVSVFIRKILEDYNQPEIPLEQIDKYYLLKILEYVQHHNFEEVPKIPKPIPSSDMVELCQDPWDAEFINSFQRVELYQLVLAVNYMDIRSLLDLACVKIAADFRDLSIEQLKEIFGIEEDLTPDIEEQLKKEFPWAAEGSGENLLAGREDTYY